ncbi:polysaccharide pyruvyl transferase family protein [Haloferax sp. KTX1]|uniref:polysaccharide pyruvyl transferase family protein n=1 Tax=Haloferax sp. KTX1 TaxID=2600597 RepID=UPI0011DD55E9|nr:polysaccharide pyruvyl transferase family protein [Haloferax sp. KTX1]
MYTVQEIKRGLRNPSLVQAQLSRIYRIYRPHDIGVHGSYKTGNIGDKALGEIFQSELTEKGYRTHIFDKNVTDSNAKKMILGGGGVIHDFYGTEHLKKRLDYISKDGCIIGVGVPGLRSEEARDLIDAILPKVRLITVRDQRSKDILERFCDAEIIKTACPAFLYQEPKCEIDDRTGVNFRPWYNRSREDMSYYFDYDKDLDVDAAKIQYINNAKRICNSVENPIFIPFHKDDEDFARRHLDIETYPYVNSVSETLDRVSKVNKMVTMRYHSLIFAAVCQKPVLPIAYAPKVSSLCDRMNIESYTPHGKIPIRFSSIEKVDDLKEQAGYNFKLLLKAIEHE